MQKLLAATLWTLSLLFLTACGGGGPSAAPQNGGSIDNVVVDPQAYYIDAVDGNDANDGKTPQTAWRSLAKVNSMKLNAGNKILFRVGQTWEGQLEIKDSGTADNPIEIGAYGDGVQPILTAVGLYTIPSQGEEAWYPYNNSYVGSGAKDDVSDPNQVWYFYSQKIEAHPQRVKVNGREILGAYYGGELSNKYKWHYNVQKRGQVFYWYGDDKPNQIETNLYASPLYIHDNQHVRVTNLTLEGGYVASLFISDANSISVDHCTLGEMSKQGVYVKAEGTTAANIAIQNCTIDSKYTFDYSDAQGPDIVDADGFTRTPTTRGASEGIMFWGGVQNSTVTNNAIKNWTHANINMSADHDEELTNNKVFNNTLTAPDIAYGGRLALDGTNASGNEVYENEIHHIKSPIQFNGHDNTFRNNNVHDIGISPLKPAETGDAVVLQAYTAPVYNNQIIDNRFKNIAKDAIKIIQPDVTNITIENNTIE